MSEAIGRSEQRILPVILCGGTGTRLWPLSREARPKQLLTLIGSKTMLQMTAGRVSDERRFDPPIVVSNQDCARAVSDQLKEAGYPVGTLIVEPVGRNTAASVATAALAAEPDALLLVMPSDHSIRDNIAFVKAMEAGRPLAEAGWLVTFGIKPDRAETGYGYIKQGRQIAPGTFSVERFAEKPNAETAEAYVAEGSYHWNAGIFLFKASAYLEALSLHATDVEHAVRAAMAAATVGANCIKPDADQFSAVRSISIDRAVMEVSDRLAVVPVDMGWSDVGSWEALYQHHPKDKEGNALSGDALAFDCTDCLLTSDGSLVVAIGVSDLAVVASGDVVIVVPKRESTRVQQVVALLKSRQDPRV